MSRMRSLPGRIRRWCRRQQNDREGTVNGSDSALRGTPSAMASQQFCHFTHAPFPIVLLLRGCAYQSQIQRRITIATLGIDVGTGGEQFFRYRARPPNMMQRRKTLSISCMNISAPLDKKLDRIELASVRRTHQGGYATLVCRLNGSAVLEKKLQPPEATVICRVQQHWITIAVSCICIGAFIYEQLRHRTGVSKERCSQGASCRVPCRAPPNRHRGQQGLGQSRGHRTSLQTRAASGLVSATCRR